MNDKRGWKGSRYQDKGGSQAATKTFNIKIELNSLNPQYELEIPKEYTINEQGLLLVGKLIPKQPSLPQFSLRWDEKGNHLNVDIKPQEKDWEGETKGYKGHQPQKADQYPGRAFLLICEFSRK